MAGLAGNALARHLVSSVPHHPTSCYFFLAASLLRIITNLMYWFLATAAVTFIVLSRSLFLISYSSHGKKCRCAFFIMPQPRFRFNLLFPSRASTACNAQPLFISSRPLPRLQLLFPAAFFFRNWPLCISFWPLPKLIMLRRCSCACCSRSSGLLKPKIGTTPRGSCR